MMGGAPQFSSAAFLLLRLTALYVVYLSPSNARLLFSPSPSAQTPVEEEVRAAHGRRRSVGLLAAHSFG